MHCSVSGKRAVISTRVAEHWYRRLSTRKRNEHQTRWRHFGQLSYVTILKTRRTRRASLRDVKPLKFGTHNLQHNNATDSCLTSIQHISSCHFRSSKRRLVAYTIKSEQSHNQTCSGQGGHRLVLCRPIPIIGVMVLAYPCALAYTKPNQHSNVFIVCPHLKFQNCEPNPVPSPVPDPCKFATCFFIAPLLPNILWQTGHVVSPRCTALCPRSVEWDRNAMSQIGQRYTSVASPETSPEDESISKYVGMVYGMPVTLCKMNKKTC